MIKLITVCVICVAFFGGCSYLNRKLGFEDDNPIEEGIEEVIEARTGFDIDLSR